MRGVLWTVALGLCAGAVPAVADTTSEDEPIPTSFVEEVTVSATRTERKQLVTPSTQSVTTAKAIEERLVNNLQDLTRYETGVSVRDDASRFGSTGFNIRGIEGNRVLMQVDGLRVADLLDANTPLGRDYVDLEILKRVEILRGPSSALYGSDAIGGTVSFLTKDPADFLRGKSEPYYVGLRTGYASANDQWTGALTAAGSAGAIDALLVYRKRTGHETDIYEEKTVTISDSTGEESIVRATANPQDVDQDSLFAKLVWNQSAARKFRVSLDTLNRQTDTDVRSSIGEVPPPSPPGVLVTAFATRDDVERRRVSLGEEYTPEQGRIVDRYWWQLSWQDSRALEDTSERRISRGTPFLRLTDNEFKQRLWDLSVQGDKSYGHGSAKYRAIFGFDYNQTRTERLRDRTQINLVTGARTKTISGETFPVKSFPDTETHRAGLFAQNEISWADDVYTLIPALRVDYYKLEPDSDAAFARSNVENFQVDEISRTSLSPKLGFLARLATDVFGYANYAHGFRAPPYDSADIAFTNSIFRYRILPNADLDPETSDGIEVGVRGQREGFSAAFAAYYNEYRDFIDVVSLGVSEGIQELRYENVGKAKIWGLEGRATAPLFRTEAGLRLQSDLSVAYAKGDNETDDVPLKSIDPLRAVLGFALSGRDQRWRAELITTAVARKSRVETFDVESDIPGFQSFKTPGYALIDLLGTWEVTKQVKLNAGVFNLLDKEYWTWSSVRELRGQGIDIGGDRAELDRARFARPGRNVSASVSLFF